MDAGHELRCLVQQLHRATQHLHELGSQQRVVGQRDDQMHHRQFAGHRRTQPAVQCDQRLPHHEGEVPVQPGAVERPARRGLGLGEARLRVAEAGVCAAHPQPCKVFVRVAEVRELPVEDRADLASEREEVACADIAVHECRRAIAAGRLFA